MRLLPTPTGLKAFRPKIDDFKVRDRSWRDPDLIENIREFRLSRRCRLDMLAASSSHRDPNQPLARSSRLAPVTGEKAIAAGSRIPLAGLESLRSKAMRAARNWHSLVPRARPKAQARSLALFRNFAPDPLRPGRDFQAGEAFPGRRDFGTHRRRRRAGLS